MSAVTDEDLHRNVTQWHQELRERITAEQRLAVLRPGWTSAAGVMRGDQEPA
jgi:hypothetical protein